MDLARVKNREALKCLPKAEPHWQRLYPGCYLGFAPSAKDGQGTWHARAYDPETRRYRRKCLGAFSELAGNAMFAAAKKKAEKLAEFVEAGGEIRAKLETVADACRVYAEEQTQRLRHRFKRYVYERFAIGKVKLDKLRRRHVTGVAQTAGAQRLRL